MKTDILPNKSVDEIIEFAKKEAREKNIEFSNTSFDVCLKAPNGFIFKKSLSFGKLGDSVHIMSHGKQLVYKCEDLGGLKETVLLVVGDLDHLIELEKKDNV